MKNSIKTLILTLFFALLNNLSAEVKSISQSYTTQEETNCAHAIAAINLGYNSLSDVDYCILNGILSNTNLTTEQKYNAMLNSGSTAVVNYANLLQSQITILNTNNFSSIGTSFTDIFVETYATDFGIPNVGSSNCTGYKTALRRCLEDQAACVVAALASGITGPWSAVIGLSYCAYTALSCNKRANQDYPDCSGITIKSSGFNTPSPTACN